MVKVRGMGRFKTLNGILAGVLLFLAGCSGFNGRSVLSPLHREYIASSRTPTVLDTETQKDSQAMHHFLVGNLELGQENINEARRNFNEASKLIDEDVPELHIQLATIYLKEGEISKALTESTLALEEGPDNTNAKIFHAGILEALNRDDEAEKIYYGLIRTNPELPVPYVLLSGILARNKKLYEAEQVLTKLLKKHSESSLGYASLGRIYESKGQLAKAMQMYNKALSKEKEDVDRWVDIIRLLIRKDDKTRAIQRTQEAIERFPDALDLRKILGQLFLGSDRIDDAIEQLKILERVEPNSNETRFKIGILQLQKQDFEAAIQSLIFVLAADPLHGRARYSLATIYLGQAKKKEAIKELAKIKKGQEQFLESRVLLGFLLRSEGDLDGAEVALEEAIIENPDSDEIFIQYCSLLRQKKRYDDVLELMEKRLELRQQTEQLLLYYAIILDDLKEFDRSMATMERVLMINPENSEALNFLAYGYAKQGVNLPQSLLLIQKALKNKPDDGYYLDTYGYILYKMGKPGEAIPLLSRAVTLTAYDVVIMEHHADALFSAGQKDKAMLVYKQISDQLAKSTELSNEDQEVLERISEKLESIQ